MGRSLARRGHLQVRPHPAPRERLLDRHSPADGERQAARRARVLVHPPRRDRALPTDERQVRVLPDGLGRQRAAHRATGADLLRRPLRPEPALRRRLHAAGGPRPEEADPDQPAQLRRAVRAAGRAGRAGLRAAVAHPRPVGGLGRALHDHRREVAAGQPDRVPAQLRPWRGLPPGGPDPLGRHVPDGGRPGRARGPRVRRPLPPGRLPPGRWQRRLHRDDAARADRLGGRADRAPRRRALPEALRYHGRLAGLRSRDPRPRPSRPPRWTRAPASPCAARSAT